MRPEPPSARNWRLVDSALLALLVLVVVGSNAVWLSQDHHMPTDDDRALYLTAACLHHNTDSPRDVHACRFGTPYPPLVTSVAKLHFDALGGPSVHLAQQSLWIFHLLLVASMFFAVRREHGRLAGLAAGLLAWVVAVDTNSLHLFYTEGAMAALAVTSVTFLMASRGLGQPIPAALLGLSLGLGLLAKWSFAFMLGPPMVIWFTMALYRAFASRALKAGGVLLFLGLIGVLVGSMARAWSPGMYLAAALGLLLLGTGGFVVIMAPALLAPGGGRRLLALLLVAVSCALVAGPWYLSNIDDLASFLSSNTGFAYDGDPMGPTETWPFYLSSALTIVQSPVLLLALVGTLAALCRRPKGLVTACMLVTASALIVLTLLPYRNDRYFAPALVLLVPPAIEALALAGRHARWLFGGVAAYGAFFACFWWTPIGEGPAPDRALSGAGNTRMDIQHRRENLRNPRFRFYQRRPQPSPEGPPLELLGRELLAQAGTDGHLVVFVPRSGTQWEKQIAVGLAAWGPIEISHYRGVDVDASLSEMVRSASSLYQSCKVEYGKWPASLFIVKEHDVRRVGGDSKHGLEEGAYLEAGGFEEVFTLSWGREGEGSFTVWRASDPLTHCTPPA